METTMTAIKPKTSAKDFFLHLAVIVTLYISTISWLNLLFSIVDYTFPDRLDYYYDPYAGSIRWTIASLVIIFPVFLLLSWLANKELSAVPEKAELGIRKFLIYLTLFLAGGVVIGDLVVLVNSFLGGEITTRFILKVLAVLVITSGVFGYYLYDLRRARGPVTGTPKIAAIVTAGLILATIIAGFVIMGSPFTQRKLRFDSQRVGDLQNIQWQVINYWQNKGKIPTTLADLRDPISGFVPPTDPETDAAYVYEKTGDRQFKLCAGFALPSPSSRTSSKPIPASPGNEIWDHEAGRICFDRVIDPELYRIQEKSLQAIPALPR